MSEDAATRPVVIFLSYRRGDTQWAARGIYDRLIIRYGPENVFRDLDGIPPGAKFRDFVERKISESDVFILLIGNAWASYQDNTGRRRLELPRDPVRVELETALRLRIPIIPVRVEGAPMPTESDLVPSIVELLEFNAAEISDSRWDFDVERLLRAINEAAERSPRLPEGKSAVEKMSPVVSPRPAEERQSQNRDAPPAAPDAAGRGVPVSENPENVSGMDALAPRTSGDHASPSRDMAGGTAARAPTTRARRDAERRARRDAEERARRKKQARRDAEEQARRDAEEQARRDAEEQARRDAEEQARRDAEEQSRRDTDHAGRSPEAGEGAPTAATSDPSAPDKQARNRFRDAALIHLRRPVIGLPVAVVIGGVVLLAAYLLLARPAEPTVMAHLPRDLRATCTANADTSATCHLPNGTVVFYSLFDTTAEADADVVDENAMIPSGDPCPPYSPSAETPIVCRYSVGAETGVVMFSYTAKPPHYFYLCRWIADAEPLLRGEMSTMNADPQDWTNLQADWTRLAGMG